MAAATWVENAIDTLITSFATTGSANLCSALAPLATTGVTIYICMLGYALMRGEMQDSAHTVIWKLIRVAFFLGISLAGGAYQSIVIEFFTGIQQAFLDIFSPSATSMGALIDNMMTPVTTMGTTYWSQAVTGTIPDFTLLLAAGIMFVCQVLMMLVGMGLYLVAKVGVQLLLAVGPAFIFCGTFPATQSYCQNWISTIISKIIMQALIVIVITMFSSIVNQYAANIQANSDSVNILISSIALLTICITLVVVMLNINSIAMALCGGASISGIGGAVSRAIMEQFTKPGRGDPNPKKPPPSGGGNIQQNNGKGSGASPTPLYQQQMLNNIQ